MFVLALCVLCLFVDDVDVLFLFVLFCLVECVFFCSVRVFPFFLLCLCVCFFVSFFLPFFGFPF